MDHTIKVYVDEKINTKIYVSNTLVAAIITTDQSSSTVPLTSRQKKSRIYVNLADKGFSVHFGEWKEWRVGVHVIPL